MLRVAKLRFSELKSDLCLMWLAAAVVILFSVVNARLIYDDISLQYAFSQILENKGWFNAALSIFAADMPSEYRTYGLSKLIQFCVWSLFGSSPYVYSILIGFSQVATAFVLRKLLVKFGIEAFTGAVVASVWMLSPFSVTACFHHYSYSILPAQIVIFSVYSLLEFRGEKARLFLSVIVGFATALTGEMHLMAALSLYLFLGLVIKSMRRDFWLSSAVTCVVVSVHFTLWRIFAADFSRSQRFSIEGSFISEGLLNKISISAWSIWHGLVDEISRVVVIENFIYIVFLLALAACVYLLKNKGFKERVEVGVEGRLFGLFLFLSAMYFLFYIVTSVFSGHFYGLMPRRYGFVSYSLLLCSISFLLATIFRGSLSSKVAQSTFVASVALAFIQLHALVIYPSVRIDSDIANKISSAVSAEQRPKTGVLFFNSSDLSIPRLKVESYTAGPRMQSSESGEIREAIFAPYWVSQRYVVNFLGFAFSGSPGPVRSDGFVNVSTNPYPGVPERVDRNGVIVVANLGFDLEDVNGKGLRVFNNYNEFEPYFFRKSIDRDVVKWQGAGQDSVVVDLGAVFGGGRGSA